MLIANSQQVTGTQRKLYGADGYDFVEEIIGDTHVLIEHLADQGYLLAFPIGTTEEQIVEIAQL